MHYMCISAFYICMCVYTVCIIIHIPIKYTFINKLQDCRYQIYFHLKYLFGYVFLFSFLLLYYIMLLLLKLL